MPTITPGDKVLVSGANGFIAIWVVRTLLERGYAVRGAVRAASKGAHLQTLFAAYGDRFEIAVVPDIAAAGAFDAAVQGVDAVAHLASPVFFQPVGGDPDEVIEPAVKGTVGILESALKHGAALKRVVVTSSVAAIVRFDAAPATLSEADWNTQSEEQLVREGRDAPSIIKYRVSKTRAERAAWELYNTHKARIAWDLTVLNPPYVFGPPIHEVASPDALNATVKDFYTHVVAGGPPDALPVKGTSWVDVRDLARAHVLALEKEAAGGERLIVSVDPWAWQEWLDVANALDPPPLGDRVLPRGNPGVVGAPRVIYDASKAARVLGITYRSRAETARDSLAEFAARGW